jgi:DNA mismatch repair protein MutH
LSGLSQAVPALQVGTFACEQTLLAAARALAGHTLSELSYAVGIELPDAPRRDKGFIGRIAERALGLHPMPGAQPAATDFEELGIELKTLPVNARLRPRESTFVCYVKLGTLIEVPWEESRVALKLTRVLFLPVESVGELAFGERRIGRAFLWSASAEQTEVLREDYAELGRRVLDGHAEALDARVGRALQLRPKAAHGGVRVRSTDGDGIPWRLTPRAFYLRAGFTEQLLRAALED